MKWNVIGAAVATLVAACSSSNYPSRDTSALSAINDEMKQAAAARPKTPTAPASASPSAAVMPPAVSSSLLPPLRGTMPKASSKQLEQHFDLVVTDVPINQVLTGLVSGTRYGIVLRPRSTVPSASANAIAGSAALAGLSDRITLNLKDVTVIEALDAIRDVYGYDYNIEGSRIYVQPPEMQTRFYQVNYIIGQRRGVSDMQVIGGATVGTSSSGSSSGGSSTSGSSTSGGSGSSSSYSSVQATALSSMSKSDVWGEIEDVVRTTLGCQIPKQTPTKAGGGGGGGAGGGQSGSSTSSGGSATRADVSYVGDSQTSERERGVDGCPDGRAMVISQMSGTILVRAMPTEHRVIEKMLRAMQVHIDRQVIIEAKIIDVELNAQSQQGINWSGFSHGLHRFSMGADPTLIDGSSFSTVGNGGGSVPPATVTSSGSSTTVTTNATSLGQFLGNGLIGNGASTAFANGLGAAVQLHNFSALINFLETQGRVHVLSSPRIATLNSQKAALKVGSEEPFVTNINSGTATTSTAGVVTAPPTLQYQPFFSGISLDVTPSVDDKDEITLHVHSMVNSVIEKDKVSLPSANSVLVPFAVNTISETDNVVKTRDGQVVVIGGLMTESTHDTRGKVPGAGDVPGIGALFSKGEQSSVKRELVILLKPTVVKDDTVWANEIASSQGRIDKFEGGEQRAADK